MPQNGVTQVCVSVDLVFVLCMCGSTTVSRLAIAFCILYECVCVMAARPSLENAPCALRIEWRDYFDMMSNNQASTWISSICEVIPSESR